MIYASNDFRPKAPYNPQRLAATGTSESYTRVKLVYGHIYLLCVGAAGIRVKFSSTPGLSNNVSNTADIVYGPWQVIPFTVDLNSQYVYAEAADGTSAYEAFVYPLQ